MSFRDRAEAGRLLAWELVYLRGTATVVLGLPRGRVPVASEDARALDAPTDVIVVRKVGMPWQPELAIGAVGEDDARVVNGRGSGSSRRSTGCCGPKRIEHGDRPPPRRLPSGGGAGPAVERR